MTNAVRRETRVVAVRSDAEMHRRDRIRWGSLWAGLVVAVSVYLVTQLALIFGDVVDLDPTSGNDALASAGAAAFAFLLGGAVAGATTVWRSTTDGLLHGFLVWAVGIAALVVLSGLGAGVALGSIDTGQAFDELRAADDQQAAQGDAEDAAGHALLTMGAALAGAALGGVLGTRLAPRNEPVIDLRTPQPLDH